MARQHYQNMVTLTRSLAKKWPQATMYNKWEKGLIDKPLQNWLDQAQVTFHNGQELANQCPHDWIALNLQPNHDQLHNLGRMVRMRGMVYLTIVTFPPPKKHHHFAVLVVPCKYFWWIKSSRYLAVNYDLLRCYCEYDMCFPDTPRNSPLSGWREQEIEQLAIHPNSMKDKTMREWRHCRSICILPQNGIMELMISANLLHADDFLLPINCLVTIIINWSGEGHFLTGDLSLQL